MRRPLQHYTPEELEKSKALQSQIEPLVFPTLKDKLVYKICMAFHRAVFGSAKFVVINSHDSCVHYDEKETLFAKLGLKEFESQLESGKPLYIPENTVADNSKVYNRHFPQLGVAWEAEKEGFRLLRTLELEIGAGFNLITLKFCPLSSEIYGKKLQLDHLSVIRGHDYFELDVENAENLSALEDILSKVQLMVGQFKNGQVGIDELLNDVVDIVISHQPPEDEANLDFPDTDYDDPSLKP